jgi:mono/diheme cytochrome c family protein
MKRFSIPTTFALSLVFGACSKPAADTNPPETTDPAATGDTTEPTSDPATPPGDDAAAKQKEAEEAAAAAAAEKKSQADAQIAQGKDLYGANCASCHGANGEGVKKKKGPAVVGAGALPLDPPKGAKMRKAQFVTAKDIADFVVANMPPKKGGSLKPEEYFAILAFDLSANGITLAEPLTADNAASITIPREAPAAPAEAAAPAADAKKAPAK